MSTDRSNAFTTGLLVALSLALIASLAVSGVLGWQLNEARREITELEATIVGSLLTRDVGNVGRGLHRLSDPTDELEIENAELEAEIERLKSENE